LSPSRNSTASCSPVEAPEGTEAEAVTPLSNSAKTLTVGFPRESNISIAFTEDIFDIFHRSFKQVDAAARHLIRTPFPANMT
jgi:hypothetical protein